MLSIQIENYLWITYVHIDKAISNNVGKRNKFENSIVLKKENPQLIINVLIGLAYI